MKPEVLIRINNKLHHGMRILEGITHSREFMRHARFPALPWQEVTSQSGILDTPMDLAIVDLLWPGEIEALKRELPLPQIILVSDSHHDLPVFRVMLDNRLAGERVCKAFLNQGLRHLAYCPRGHGGKNYSLHRGQGFQEAAKKAGIEVHLFTRHLDLKGQELHQAIEVWLQQLPKPVGVMSANDLTASLIIQICKKVELAIPEDISVAGVDNEPVICQFSDPKLSSLDGRSIAVGEKAAELALRILEKETGLQENHWIEPGEFHHRQSSDHLIAEDPRIAGAILFIRQHAAHPITVEDVCEHAALGRSSLDRGFKQVIGRTVSSEIQNVHLDRAKHLLIHTDWPMKRIASASGYPTGQALSQIFALKLNLSPNEYRRQNRFGYPA